MTDEVGYKWRPIEDLSKGERSFRSDDLDELFKKWLQKKEEISVHEFITRLKRQWAIETGIIERVYTLDRGMTEILIEHGIDAALIPHNATDKSPELVAEIIKDQEAAIDGVFDFIKGNRTLSTSYIREMHALFTRNQPTTTGRDQFGNLIEIPLLKGEYKKHSNNPRRRQDGLIHEYCPPEQVSSEMDRLIELHQEHMDAHIHPAMEAAWLHHRFTQIHPFQDGNGRVARALATLVLLKAGWFPLVITNDDRVEYLDALGQADERDIFPLTGLFIKMLRKSFNIAFEIVSEIKIDEIFKSAKEYFKGKSEMERAKDIAIKLHKYVDSRLERINNKIVNEFNVQTRILSRLRNNVPSRYSKPIETVWAAAKQDGYIVCKDGFTSWSVFDIQTDPKTEIIFSIHQEKLKFDGDLRALICMTYFQFIREGTTMSNVIKIVSDGQFEIKYNDDENQKLTEFIEWFEAGLQKGLSIWKENLSK